jgi:hypothetical protein
MPVVVLELDAQAPDVAIHDVGGSSSARFTGRALSLGPSPRRRGLCRAPWTRRRRIVRNSGTRARRSPHGRRRTLPRSGTASVAGRSDLPTGAYHEAAGGFDSIRREPPLEPEPIASATTWRWCGSTRSCPSLAQPAM